MGKLDKILMSRALLTKTVLGAAAAAALTTGAVMGVSAYRSGNDFHPSGTERDFNANQVHFDDNQDVKGSDSSAEQDNSEMLEKDDSADDTDDPNSGDNADFMFQRERMQQNFADPVSIVSNTAGTNVVNGGVTTSGSGDSVYNVTNDRNNADVIIGGRPGGTTVAVPGNGDGGNGIGTGSGETPGGNGGATTPTNPAMPSNPSEPSNPSTPSTPTNPKPSKPGGGNSGGGTSGGGAETPSTPAAPSDSATITIPDEKPKSSAGLDPDASASEFDESVVNGKDPNNLYPTVTWPEYDSEYSLYRGQTITLQDVFYGIDAYVRYFDWDSWDSAVYYWTLKDLQEGKFIRITGISFDDGETVIDVKDLPVTIPETGNMTIYVEYRLSSKGAWIQQEVKGAPIDQRTYVLNTKLTSANQAIKQEDILNYSSDMNAAHINLLRYMCDIFSTKANTDLDKLFPGWTERGEQVPFLYTVGKQGRHILEASDFVPLDTEKYQVQLKTGWLPSDYTSEGFGSLCYLQTLVGYTPETNSVSTYAAPSDARSIATAPSASENTLNVPMYVQAVAIPANSKVVVDKLVLPKTVWAVDTSSGLRVDQAYEVAKDNTALKAENGMLYSKDGTSLLGIPYSTEEVVIPSTVESVSIGEENQIKTLYIQAETADEVPDINYENLHTDENGEPVQIITSSNAAMEKIIRDNKGVPANTTVEVISGEEFILDGQFIISKDSGELYKAVDGKETITLPASVRSIGEGAFEGSGAKRIIMPEGSTITFKSGWTNGSDIEQVLCATEKQAAQVREQLEQAETPDTVSVSMIYHAGGYAYSVDDDGNATLLDAPADVTSFDGTIPDTDIVVKSIAGNAFSGCESLQWVLLKEDVTSIGREAFENCTALEGVFISNKNSVFIGDGAFDNCDALRFVASNAMQAEMENGYDPVVTTWLTQKYYGAQFFFVPAESQGYGSSAKRVMDSFAINTIGDHGEIALFGLDGDCQTVVLRSQAVLEGDLSADLKGDQPVIGAYAFANTEGEFTLNGNKFFNTAFGEGAFFNSDLTGDLEAYGSNNEIWTDAFNSCKLQTAAVEGASMMDKSIFSNCKQLEEVTLAADDNQKFDLYAGSFDGCSKLKKITLGRVPNLIMYYNGAPFQFNTMDWTPEEEAENIDLVLLEDASLSELVSKWRYAMAGYVAMYRDTAYQELLYACDNDISLVKQKLTEAENRILKMLNSGYSVSKPTDLYCYTQDGIYLTLVDVSTDEETVSLDWSTMGMPEGWCLDYLAQGAFKNSPQIGYLSINDDLVGIESGVFNGMDPDGDLNVVLGCDEVPELYYFDEEHPFSFGIDEDRLHINIWSFSLTEQDYLESWIYPMVGYENLSQMLTAYGNKYPDATAEELQDMIREALLPAEKRLRRILGMADTDVLTIKTDVPVSKTETEKASNSGSSDAVDTTPEVPDNDSDSSDNSDNTPATDDDDTDNSQTGDDTDDTTDSTGTAIVLPMENGKYEIVIPSLPSDSASTEEKGETE